MHDEICRLYRRAVETGDEDAWSDLVGTCETTIRHRLRALIGRRGVAITPQETEELLQELWCRVLSTPEAARFRGTCDVELWGWLQRILRRLVLDLERSRHTKKRRAEIVGDAWEDERGSSWRDTVPSPEHDPEARYLLKERARVVERACREVTAPSQHALYLKVLRLALVEGLSSLDVCRRLQLRPEPARIDGLLHRLKRRLESRGLTLPHRAAFSAS